MKITDVQTHVLSTPLDEPFAFSMGWVKRRSTMIVEVITDEGITGWGESLCHGLQPPEIARTIVEVALKPILVGQDPFDVDVLWERMYNLTRPYGQKGAVPNAISGVDIAIWDCLGRALGKPVHKLLGGPIAPRSSRMQPVFTASRASRIRPMPSRKRERHLEQRLHGDEAQDRLRRRGGHRLHPGACARPSARAPG